MEMCGTSTSFTCMLYSQRKENAITNLIIDLKPPNFFCNTEKWRESDWILSRYWSPGDGFQTKKINSSDRLTRSRDQLTYGEVTPLGVRQLAYEMGIAVDCDGEKQQQPKLFGDTYYDADTDTNADVIFYDIGSGVGRLVTQIYLDQPNKILKAVGIEMAKDRHDIGTNALNLLFTDHKRNNNVDADAQSIINEHFPIQLIHGDIVELDLLDSTSHVFISSLCFPKHILSLVQEKLLNLSHLHVVASLNRLDLIYQHDEWEERSALAQMSWGAGTIKLYYKKINMVEGS